MKAAERGPTVHMLSLIIMLLTWEAALSESLRCGWQEDPAFWRDEQGG